MEISMTQLIASFNFTDSDNIKTVLINKSAGYDHAIECIYHSFPTATCINIDVAGHSEKHYPPIDDIINC